LENKMENIDAEQLLGSHRYATKRWPTARRNLLSQISPRDERAQQVFSARYNSRLPAAEAPRRSATRITASSQVFEDEEVFKSFIKNKK
jgi:hypothetical protein